MSATHHFQSSKLTLRVATYAAAAAVAALPAMAGAAVVTTTPTTPIPIPNTTNGLYLNLVTGATSTSSLAGYDINPYGNALIGLSFFAPSAPQGVLANGTVAESLMPGSVVGPAPVTGAFRAGNNSGAAVDASPGTDYIGIAFTDESTNLLDFGYLQLSVGTAAGFPASIVSYGYNNAGAAITIPSTSVPEPTTALGLAAFAGGATLMRRRRRRASTVTC